MISLASGASIHAVVYLVDTARTGLDNGVTGSASRGEHRYS